MKLIWEPSWYELDQSIVVGDIDYFYITKEMTHFANGFASANDCEVRARVLNIVHKNFGKVKGILTYGLDYVLYLDNGAELLVDAEERPGHVYDWTNSVDNWIFEVEMEIIEITGVSSEQRLGMISKEERSKNHQQRIERYKKLLNI